MSQECKDVICIGQALTDCIVRGREQDAYRKNVNRAQSITLSVGGDAFNEACSLARMGWDTKLVCGLGCDLAGDTVFAEAERNGIDTEGICRIKEQATPVAVLMVDPSGGRESVNSPAAQLAHFIPQPEMITPSRVVSLASLFRAPLDRKETLLALAEAIKRQGSTLCADTKLPLFHELTLSDLKDFLPLVDYLFPNEDEASYYTKKTDVAEMAEEFLRCGVRHVIIKRGAKGCCGFDGTEKIDVPAFSAQAVDSTGAGDAFAAGFISALLEEKDFRACLQTGASAAAICVQHVGSTGAIRSREQVAEWTEKAGRQ